MLDKQIPEISLCVFSVAEKKDIGFEIELENTHGTVDGHLIVTIFAEQYEKHIKPFTDAPCNNETHKWVR